MLKIGSLLAPFDRLSAPRLLRKKEENRLRLTVDCREANALFVPPPSVELPGDGLSRIEVDSGLAHGESLLACTTGALMLPTVFTGCVSLGRIAIFSAGQVCRTSTSR